MEKFLLYSEIDGIYLGFFMGMGFWSKLDAVGQEEAPVFDSKDDAWKHVISWDGTPAKDLKTVAVNVKNHTSCYATMQDIAETGLPLWNPQDC